MDARKQRELQYFKQRHALVPVNPDTPEFLERFEDADASRRKLLELQRLQFQPTKALKKAQTRRKKKQRKGAKSNIRGEVAQIKTQQRRFERGERRYRETQEPRIYGDGPAPDLADILRAFGGAGGGAGGFHHDPAVEMERQRVADLQNQRNFQVAQDRLRLEGRQLDVNRHLADRDRAEGQRRFNIQHAEDVRGNVEDDRLRHRAAAAEEQRIRDEARLHDRDIDVREQDRRRLAQFNDERAQEDDERNLRREAEEIRQFDAKLELEQARLELERQGVGEGEVAYLRQRLGEVEERGEGLAQRWAAGQVDLERARDQAAAADRESAVRDAEQRAEIIRLADEVERERARQPPPPRIQTRIERVDVPAAGLSAADRRFFTDELARFHQRLGSMHGRQSAIESYLDRMGRGGDDSEVRRLSDAADEFFTPTASGSPRSSGRPRSGRGPTTTTSRSPRRRGTPPPGGLPPHRRPRGEGGGGDGGEPLESPIPEEEPPPEDPPPQPLLEEVSTTSEEEDDDDDDDGDEESTDDERDRLREQERQRLADQQPQPQPEPAPPPAPAPEPEVEPEEPEEPPEPGPGPDPGPRGGEPIERIDPDPEEPPIPPSGDTEDDTGTDTDSDSPRGRRRDRRRGRSPSRSPSPGGRRRRRSPSRRRRSPSPSTDTDSDTPRPRPSPRPVRREEVRVDTEDESDPERVDITEEVREEGSTYLQRLRNELEDINAEWEESGQQHGLHGFTPHGEEWQPGQKRTRKTLQPIKEGLEGRVAREEEREQGVIERILALGGRILGRETPDEALRRVRAEGQRRRDERERIRAKPGQQSGGRTLPSGQPVALTQQDIGEEELAELERELLQTKQFRDRGGARGPRDKERERERERDERERARRKRQTEPEGFQELLLRDIQQRGGGRASPVPREEEVDTEREAMREREQRSARLMERQVPQKHLDQWEVRDSAALFDEMATSGDLQVRPRGRAAGRGALSTTGFVLENPHEYWVADINPGGRVNIVRVEADGTIGINTGQGKRGIRRTGENVVKRLLTSGDLRLVRDPQGAERRPGFSVGKTPKRGGISAPKLPDEEEEAPPRRRGGGRGGGKKKGGKKKR